MDHLEAAAVAAAGRGGREVRILAPAKINVGLAVLGRRPDGYHELRTVFQAVSLSDRLVLTRTRRGVRLRCPALPGLGRENLAHRAARLFFSATGIRGGVAIELEKRIPAGGGLGGGSSDAAAVLLGCCRLYGRDPGLQRLLGWAAQLGSDVPFFIAGGAALGSGRGELLTPLPAWKGPAHALVHVPPAGLATARVYAGLRAAGLTGERRDFTILLERWREGNLRRLGAALFNDLEAAAFALAPELARVKEGLLAEGARGALLCGSGSCVVGLFDSAAAAEGARRRVGRRFPGRLHRVRFLRQRVRWGVVKR